MTEKSNQPEPTAGAANQNLGAPADLSSLRSPYGVKETVSLITQFAKAKGLTIFTVIDHAEAARSVGLQMPETSVVILGNPKAGTNLMLSHPDLAIDLPTRVLVRESAEQQGSTSGSTVAEEGGPPDGRSGCEVLLVDPEVISRRYGLNQDETEVLGKLVSLIASALEQ